QDQWTTVNEFASQVGAEAGSGYVSGLTKPMEMIYENTLKYINGEMELEQLENSNNRAEAFAAKGWLEQEGMARLVAGSNLFQRSNVLDFAIQTSPIIAEYVSNNGNASRRAADPFVDDSDPNRKAGFK